MRSGSAAVTITVLGDAAEYRAMKERRASEPSNGAELVSKLICFGVWRPERLPLSEDAYRRIRRACAGHNAAVRRAMLVARQLARAGDGPNVALRKVIAPNTSVPAPPLLVAG